MKNKGMMISVTALILGAVQVIAGAVGVSRLPETVPTHFNAEWVCDGVGSRWILMILAGLPLIIALAALISVYRQSKQSKVTSILLLPLTVFMSAVFWLSYPSFQSGAGIGDKVNPEGFGFILPLMVSMLFVIIGNYLPVIQPNKVMGIRTPSTLKNPQCWRLTHRFAGRLMFVTGLLLGLLVLTVHLLHQTGAVWVNWVFIAGIAVNMAAMLLYARLHRNDT